MGVQGVHGVQGSVIASLLRVWVSETRGQVLLTGWAVTFVGITGRAFWLRRKQKKALANTAVAAAAKKTPIEAAPESERPCRRDEKEKRANTEKKEAGPILSVLRLAMPSYRGRAGAWLVVFSLGLGVKVLVAGRASSEIGRLGSLLAKREWRALFERQLVYALWAVPAAATTALQKYSRERAALCLRDELMHTIHERLGAAGADGPAGPGSSPARRLPLALIEVVGAAPDASRGGAVDVGVSDPRAFCTAAVELYETLSKPMIEVTLLSIKLAMMMGPAQLCKCYVFFAAAGCWTRFAGPSIATMTASVADAEAELLGQHAHLAEYAEEVALLGGGAAEAGALQAALESLTGRTGAAQLQRFGADTLDGYVLRHIGILVAFTTMLPAVVASAPAQIDPTEYFLTSLHLLVHVAMA